MATMTTQLPPPSHTGTSAAPVLPAPQAQLALAELFPDIQAAADEALADLFPALRLSRRTPPAANALRR